MNEKVATVVVTYNRKHLLIECLDAIRKQTHKIEAIYIIDNASTDGTPNYLLENKYISILPVSSYNKNQLLSSNVSSLNKTIDEIKIFYVRKFENDGGAGGFNEGIKLAYEDGYQWIWVMDDDVEASPDCLTILFSSSDKSKCLHPLKKYNDEITMNWESILDVHTGRIVSLFNKGLDFKDISFINVGNFEGMLIHKTIVEKIGFPDRRYFICGDDLIYGYHANIYTNVCLCRDAIIYRKKNSSEDRDISDLTLYYSLRNMHLRNEFLNTIYPESNKKRRLYSLFIFIKTLHNILSNNIKRNGCEAKLKTIYIWYKAIVGYKKRKVYKTF